MLTINCLPPYLNDDDFEALFASVGQTVTCKLIKDENAGSCLGSGFVEYERDEEAEDAIKMLNGKQVFGKSIKVAYLTKVRIIPKIYVHNLPTWSTASWLRKLFCEFGEIFGCHIYWNSFPNETFGLIRFQRIEEAVRAMNCINGLIPVGCKTPIEVGYTQDRGYNVRNRNCSHRLTMPIHKAPEISFNGLESSCGWSMTSEKRLNVSCSEPVPTSLTHSRLLLMDLKGSDSPAHQGTFLNKVFQRQQQTLQESESVTSFNYNNFRSPKNSLQNKFYGTTVRNGIIGNSLLIRNKFPNDRYDPMANNRNSGHGQNAY